ncbi:MAG TPA: hypothetical protein VKZ81_34505 [Pseudonocardia sp.]|jgi:hypothetical protein|uniref:hypothetical protein n=1 Tax=Pseudonocardia sp. TaxID=60912 RepID=UPI002B4B7D7E|nr:hypothetical protein [Pseudonocardia sp.]HLU60602.1 hypothetical protein [Pseudonocardia sp.]
MFWAAAATAAILVGAPPPPDLPAVPTPPGSSLPAITAERAAQNPTVRDPGRIALSADGNQHDEDDWASSAMALAILAHAGFQENVVNYIYNNHIWDSSSEHRRNMTESVLGAGERFGFDLSRFYDGADPQQLEAGVAALTAEINASTPDDELTIVLAGPMETTWMALEAADPAARRHVKCVSHGNGTFNQTHGKTDHGGHSYDDVLELGCQRVQIPDQNGNLGPTKLSDWDYLRDLGPEMAWVHSRLEVAEKGDVSDAGMVYFVITGEERVSRSELRKFLTTPRSALLGGARSATMAT